MKYNLSGKRNFVKTLLKNVLFCTAALFFTSCLDFFNLNKKTVTVNGCIYNEEMNETDYQTNRSAFPDSGSITYFITAYSGTEEGASVKAEFSGGKYSFSIPLTEGNWYLYAKGYSSDTQFDSTTLCFSGVSNVIVITLSGNELTVKDDIKIETKPVSDGYGTVKLPVVIADESITAVKAFWGDSSEETLYVPEGSCPKTTYLYLINQTDGAETTPGNVINGKNDVTLKFYNSTNETLFMCTETVYVYTNLCTDSFVENAATEGNYALTTPWYSYNAATEKIELKVTPEITDLFKKETLYVKYRTGTEDYEGTESNPYHTLYAAVKAAINKTKCTIYIIGDYDLNLEGGPDAGFADDTDTDRNKHFVYLTNKHNLDLTICSSVPGTRVKIDLQKKGKFMGIDASTETSDEKKQLKLTLKDLEIKQSKSTGNDGGAIGMMNCNSYESGNGARIYMENCIFRDCLSTWNSAGAINISKGNTLTAVNTGFYNNKVTDMANNTYGNGGAIYAWSGFTLRNCTFQDNSAAGKEGLGGAIYVNIEALSEKKYVIEDCVFKGNSGKSGGAIYGISGFTLKNSTFENNTASGASGSGGAIYVTYSTGKQENYIIEDCVFTQNVGNDGGAIAVMDSTPVLKLKNVNMNGNKNGALYYNVTNNNTEISGENYIYENTNTDETETLNVYSTAGETYTFKVTGDLTGSRIGVKYGTAPSPAYNSNILLASDFNKANTNASDVFIYENNAYSIREKNGNAYIYPPSNSNLTPFDYDNYEIVADKSDAAEGDIIKFTLIYHGNNEEIIEDAAWTSELYNSAGTKVDAADLPFIQIPSGVSGSCIAYAKAVYKEHVFTVNRKISVVAPVYVGTEKAGATADGTKDKPYGTLKAAFDAKKTGSGTVIIRLTQDETISSSSMLEMSNCGEMHFIFKGQKKSDGTLPVVTVQKGAYFLYAKEATNSTIVTVEDIIFQGSSDGESNINTGGFVKTSCNTSAPSFILNLTGSTEVRNFKNTLSDSPSAWDTHGFTISLWGNSSCLYIRDNVKIHNNSNSATEDSTTDINGGVIYSAGSVFISGNAEITNNMCTNNSTKTDSETAPNGYAAYGGAIYSTGTIAISGNAKISENYAVSNLNGALGGAIYSEGTLKISGNAIITENYVSSTNGNAYGGAIYAKHITIKDRVKLLNNITEGKSAKGGALYIYDGSGSNTSYEQVIIQGSCELSGNKVLGINVASGAACYSDEYNTYSGKVIISGAVNISENVATVTTGTSDANTGGVIYTSGPLEITALVADNEVTSPKNISGGIIYSNKSVNISGTASFTGNKVKSESNATICGGIIWLNSNSTVQGATFSDNEVTNKNGSELKGGIIYCNKDKRLTLEDSIIKNNTINSVYKVTGGIVLGMKENSTTPASVINSVITDNTIISSGYSIDGGVFCCGTGVKVTGSSLKNNTITTSAAITGGVIKSINSVTIDESSLIQGNKVESTGSTVTGGVVYSGTTLTIPDASFAANEVTSKSTDSTIKGGVLYSASTLSISGTVSFTGNKVKSSPEGNSEIDGGIIWFGSNSKVQGVTFSGNEVVSKNVIMGGIVYCNKDIILTLEDSIIKNNTITGWSINGGIVVGRNGSSTTPATVKNTVVSDNTIISTVDVINGGLLTYNTGVKVTGLSLKNNTITAAKGITGGVIKSDNSVTIDESSLIQGNKVKSTGSTVSGGVVYSGTTLTIPDASFAANEVTAKTTITGGAVYSKAAANISGTVSFTGNNVESTSNDINGGICYGEADITLNGASVKGNTITAYKNVEGGIICPSFNSTQNILVTASVISGNKVNSTYAGINGGIIELGDNKNLEVSGASVISGNVVSTGTGTFINGGIIDTSSSSGLVLDGVTMKNNTVSAGSGKLNGGIIYSQSSSATRKGNTLISGNVVETSGDSIEGGIIYSTTKIEGNGTFVISDNTVSSQSNGAGGVIKSDSVSGFTIVNNTVYNCKGICYHGTGSEAVYSGRVRITGNKGSYTGGAVYFNGTSLNINTMAGDDVIIRDNESSDIYIEKVNSAEKIIINYTGENIKKIKYKEEGCSATVNGTVQSYSEGDQE